MTDLLTVTRHFRWDDEESRWLPVDATRDADNRVLGYLQPDRQGVSEQLDIIWLLHELPDRYRPRIAGNGSCMFNKGRGLGKDFVFTKEYKQGLIAVQCVGLYGQIQRTQTIRADIAVKIRSLECVVLGTHQQVQVDHKSGRKDDRRLEDPLTQRLDDFQPMNSTVNAVKREACKECQKTGRRYDARPRGYSHGWWLGGAPFETCNGCYWNDPIRFNVEMSKGFNSGKKRDR